MCTQHLVDPCSIAYSGNLKDFIIHLQVLMVSSGQHLEHCVICSQSTPTAMWSFVDHRTVPAYRSGIALQAVCRTICLVHELPEENATLC
jgi:hypothetical protein